MICSAEGSSMVGVWWDLVEWPRVVSIVDEIKQLVRSIYDVFFELCAYDDFYVDIGVISE
jgi:hypothetical protein